MERQGSPSPPSTPVPLPHPPSQKQVGTLDGTNYDNQDQLDEMFPDAISARVVGRRWGPSGCGRAGVGWKQG